MDPERAAVPAAASPASSPFGIPPAAGVQPAPMPTAPLVPPEMPGEQEEAKPFMIFSPLGLISGPEDQPLSKHDCIKMHWIHYLWLIIFAICYYAVIEWIDTDKDVLAGEVQDVLGEFFPDQAVEHERMSKGEIAPIFAELMNGDDVSKLLNWYQSFCLWKAGSDEHVPFGWNCGINNIVIENTHPAHWDFIKNSPPESWSHNESIQLRDHFCSAKFLHRHVICGDDPNVVPYGDVDAFRKMIRKEVARENNTVVSDSYMFDSTYDEFAILNGYPMLNILQRAAEMGISKARRQEKREEADEQAAETKSSLAEEDSSQEPGKLASSDLDRMSFWDLIRFKGKRARHPIKSDKFKAVPHSILQDTWESLRKQAREKKRMKQSPTVGRVAPHSRKSRQQRDQATQSSLASSREVVFASSLQHAANEAVQEAMRDILEPKSETKNKKKGDDKTGGNDVPQEGQEEEVSMLSDNPIDHTAGQLKFPKWVEGPHHAKELEVAVAEQQIDKDSTENADNEETNAGLWGEMGWCYAPTSIQQTLFRTIEEMGFWSEDRLIDKASTLKVLESYGKEGDIEKIWKDLGGKDKVNYKELGEYFKDKLLAGTQIKDWAGLVMRPICTNHHFGMLHMCGPEYVKVTFHMERLTWGDKPPADPWRREHGSSEFLANRHSIVDLVLEFYAIGMDISQTPETDGPTGWYYSQIQMDTEDYIGTKGTEHIVFSILTVVLFVPLFLIDFLWSLVKTPVALFNILSSERRKNVTRKSHVWMLISEIYDGRGCRYRFLSPTQCMMENVICIFFLGGIVQTVFQSMKPAIPPRGAWPSEDCRNTFMDLMSSGDIVGGHADGTTIMLLAPAVYLQHCYTEDVNYLAESLYIYLWDGKFVHGIALLTLCMRLLDIFNGFEATRWLNRTLEVALANLLWFIFFYLCVNLAYASMLHLCFGSKFVQFKTYSRSFLIVTLFSFGMTDFAMEGVHTYEDYGSGLLTIFMLIYAICVVAVGMGFFATIILDAYGAVQDQESYDKSLKKDGIDGTTWLTELLYDHVDATENINVTTDFRFSSAA